MTLDMLDSKRWQC
uniref:Uncharacterized protein n=1 Tax=Rhizophora mucronata TaxID=61149 RepID=A0A2P2P9P4_RHIMU